MSGISSRASQTAHPSPSQWCSRSILPRLACISRKPAIDSTTPNKALEDNSALAFGLADVAGFDFVFVLLIIFGLYPGRVPQLGRSQ